MKNDVIQKQQEKMESYKTVFSSVPGEIVLEDLMEFCHIKQSVYDRDPMEMARQAGEQNVALYILSILKVDLKELKEMMSKERQYGTNSRYANSD